MEEVYLAVAGAPAAGKGEAEKQITFSLMLGIKLHITASHLADRKRFLAQELIVRFLEPIRSRGQAAADPAIVDSVIAAAYVEARGGVKLSKGSTIAEHVAEMVATASAEWQKRAGLKEPEGPSSHLRAAFEQGFKYLRAAAAGLRCKHCKHDNLCAGLVLPDVPRAASESLCLKSASQMARDIAKFTESLYHRYIGVSQNIEVDIFFANAGNEDRASGITEFVRPQPRYDLAGGVRPAWIELRLPLASFGTCQYFSLYYVLAHELAVHGVQELLRDEPPAWPKQRVAFAEGLVDRVIYEELIDDIRSQETIVLSERSDALDSIDNFHATRKDVPGVQRTFWAPDITYGRRAYETLRKLGRYAIRLSIEAGQVDAEGAKSEARTWAHATILALNLMPLNEGERALIVEVLNGLDEFFDPKGFVRPLPKRKEKILTDFVGILAEIQEGPRAEDKIDLLEVAHMIVRLQGVEIQ